MKRLLIIAHYDPAGQYSTAFFEYVCDLNLYCAESVLVSTGLARQDKIRAAELFGKVIVRKNEGYDFVSWKTGLEWVGDRISRFDEVVIANDSVFGPFGSFESVFGEMTAQGADFWGLAGNMQFAYHLQSFFVAFSKKVVSSDAFRRFWSGMSIEPDKQQLIVKHEIGLTQQLIRAGFRTAAFFEPHPIYRAFFSGRKKVRPALTLEREAFRELLYWLSHPFREGVNFTIDAPGMLLKAGVPIVKREVFIKNPRNVSLPSLFRVMRRYNLSLALEVERLLG